MKSTEVSLSVDDARPVISERLLQSAEEAAALMKSLSHPIRLLILCRLSEGTARVNELESLLGVPQPAVSKQLTRLREEGFVRCERDGRSIIYELADERTLNIVKTLYVEFCNDAEE